MLNVVLYCRGSSMKCDVCVYKLSVYISTNNTDLFPSTSDIGNLSRFLTILFISFGLLSHIDFKIIWFSNRLTKSTWWRLFQKCIVRTKLHIYVINKYYIPNIKGFKASILIMIRHHWKSTCFMWFLCYD